MSKRKNLERALAGKPVRHEERSWEPMFLKCSKCGNIISEALVEGHINDCMNGKAQCAKCTEYISAAEFVEHFKNCPGKKTEVLNADK